MTPQTDFQAIYRAHWTRDATAYAIRMARERAELNAAIGASHDPRNPLLIEVTCAAISSTDSATANEIAARVVGLSLDTAQKYLRILESRGRVRKVGKVRGEVGRGRQLWQRVAP